MPKFVSDRDVRFFQTISKELVDNVVEVTVIIYKMIVEEIETNIYGESDKKIFYEGVKIPCLIERDDPLVSTEGFGPDVNQNLRFKFLKQTLKESNIYPETGDFIDFNNSYYEINNVIENQLVAGQPYNNYSIVCSTHLTRNTTLNIQERQV